MPFSVYILLLSNGRLYVGHTEDLDSRLIRHGFRDASQTTRRSKMEKCLYSEEHPDRGSAQKREGQLKKWSHGKKMALVQGHVGDIKALAKRRFTKGRELRNPCP